MPIHNQFIYGPNNQTSPDGLREVGAFFAVEVHVPPELAQALANSNNPVPAPQGGIAVIDTGASRTCIHEPVLQMLGLNPISSVQVGTASGTVQQSVYPARIVFPTKGWTLDVPGAIAVNLGGQLIATTPPQRVIALLGRDLLQHMSFSYNGPGGFWSVSI